MKLLLVVQRYGPEVTGGSEALCRAIAQRLAERHDVSVATSCATDYVTWANVLPPGTSQRRPRHRAPLRERPPASAAGVLATERSDLRRSGERRGTGAVVRAERPRRAAVCSTSCGRAAATTIASSSSRIAMRRRGSGCRWSPTAPILVPTAEHDQLIRSSTILAPYLPAAARLPVPDAGRRSDGRQRRARRAAAVRGDRLRHRSGAGSAVARRARRARRAAGFPRLSRPRGSQQGVRRAGPALRGLRGVRGRAGRRRCR